MNSMFSYIEDFNVQIGGWNVSSVEDMSGMFSYCNSFNQDLSNWDVGNVRNFQSMFEGANAFNQSLADWNISNADDMIGMLNLSGLSTANYDATLLGWSSLQTGETKVPDEITLGSEDLLYCDETGHNKLTDPIADGGFGWTINDDSKNCTEYAPFITTWDASDGIIHINVSGSSHYHVRYFRSDDQNIGGAMNNISGSLTINVPSPGIYTVVMTGEIPNPRYSPGTNARRLLTIEEWGANPWTGFFEAFYGCSNLTINATDAPDLSRVVNTSYMFAGCSQMNQDISFWDVSNVEQMQAMFYGASSFNQSLDSWDVKKVRIMSSMFNGATSFNASIGSWEVGKVNYMINMFRGATSFNQDISTWDMREVRSTKGMFWQASAFNQDLNTWETNKVTSTEFMFYEAISFNGDLNGMDVSSVTRMNSMFGGARKFNQDLSSWDVSNVLTMSYMFQDADAFDQDISSWNVSKVGSMFAMFLEAKSFDQSLGAWDISNVGDMRYMLDDSGIGKQNYDNTLIGWADLDEEAGETQIPIYITLGAVRLKYCNGETERNLLTTPIASGGYGWTIEHDILDCSGSSTRLAEEPIEPVLAEEDEELEGIYLYPNPSDQYFQLVGSELVGASLVLVDLNGKEVIRIEVLEASNFIDTSELPTGMYNIQIISGSEVTIKKILIQH